MANYADKLKNPKWQRKRLEIFQRDSFKCQLCDDDATTLAVHHKRYISGKDPWDYDNNLLITLCEKCHQKIHPGKSVSKSVYSPVITEKTQILISDKDAKKDVQKSIPPVSFGILSKIRQEVVNRMAYEEKQLLLPVAITIELLEENWKLMTENLRIRKRPSFQSFGIAHLSVIHGKFFEINVFNQFQVDQINLEQDFILKHMYRAFRTQSIGYRVHCYEYDPKVIVNPNLEKIENNG